MFERISRGWELAKQSFGVLMSEKKLLIFPFVSAIACVIVLASFALPLWFSGAIEDIGQQEKPANNPIYWVVLFAFYLVNYFVIVFFNSALVACAVIRLEGGQPTLGMGLSAAMARLPQIFGWALVAASVGVILQAIESRSEKFGQIVSGLLGMAWSVVTFFVVPVIVIEKAGPVEAIKRSTAILKKTWGESLTANFGVGLIAFLLNIPAILAIVGGGMLVAANQIPLGIVLIVIGVLGILFVSLVSSAMNTIVLAAMYLYATTNRVPSAFDETSLVGAFGQK